MLLHLGDDIAAALRADGREPASAAAAFEQLWQLPGESYRRAKGRHTLRVVIGERAYFAKRHRGIPWRDVAKELLSLKWPVVGAGREFAACRHLAAHGVPVPVAAAYGRRGWNPTTRRSLVLCEALGGFASLEDVARRWHCAGGREGVPLAGEEAPLALRRRMLREVAALTRRLHAAGVNHRDYYLCHLFVHVGKLAAGEIALAVIDLHRAGIRRRVPRRWRLRDLAALLYSAAAVARTEPSLANGGWRLSRTNQFRFVRDYAAARPAAAIRRNRRFWRAVAERAAKLERRGERDTAALPLPHPADPVRGPV